MRARNSVVVFWPAAHMGHGLMVVAIPGKLDLREWYAGSTLTMIMVLGALVAYGAWATLQGREQGGMTHRL